MPRYIQIDKNGVPVSDSFLSGEVNKPNMIPVDMGVDIGGKRYDNGEWVDYVPPVVEVVVEPTTEELIMAELLVGQMEILTNQQAHDEVLAEILLGQLGEV